MHAFIILIFFFLNPAKWIPNTELPYKRIQKQLENMIRSKMKDVYLMSVLYTCYP